MSIKLADFVIPAGGSTEFLIEDKYIKGGLHIVADSAGLLAMDPTLLKVGMIAVTQDDKKLHQLANDMTWADFALGGNTPPFVKPVRQTVTHFIDNVPAGGSFDFELPLGLTILVYALSVDTSCKIQAFETAQRSDSNPYTFVATPTHLADDGSTLMTDGTVLRGRRYSILSNQENSGNATTDINIYFRVTSTDVVDKSVTLTLSFLPIESI